VSTRSEAKSQGTIESKSEESRKEGERQWGMN
jgi:hypothetical protein